MDVEGALVERVLGDAEPVGVRPHVREGDTRRLLHHVAELAGQDDVATALVRGGLDEEHVAAGAGDREAGSDAGHRSALGRFVEEPLPPERAPDANLPGSTKY